MPILELEKAEIQSTFITLYIWDHIQMISPLYTLDMGTVCLASQDGCKSEDTYTVSAT